MTARARVIKDRSCERANSEKRQTWLFNNNNIKLRCLCPFFFFSRAYISSLVAEETDILQSKNFGVSHTKRGSI